MSITFSDVTNRWIDGLVKLANERQGNHDLEGLFVPPRELEPMELVNDAPSEDDLDSQIIDFSAAGDSQSFSPVVAPPISDAVVAIDSGVVDIGELATGGTVFAVRGAAVCYPPDNAHPFICRYNTGPLVIDGENMYPLFHYLGARLGKEDLFVALLSDPPYYRPRQAMTETPNQIQDRCRNFVERMIQEEGVSILTGYGGGILLIDGALPAGTYDTPDIYTRTMLTTCRDRHISVAAISKKTRITVGGRPISSLFTEEPDFVGFVPLSDVIRQERQTFQQEGHRVRSESAVTLAEAIYAVRFSYASPGLTFRVDVNAASGSTPDEVLNLVQSRCQIYGGYPRPLIEAHQYSSFFAQDVQLLMADVVVRLGVRPQEQPTMNVLFEPFGAFGK
jgi:hypothetical protein